MNYFEITANFDKVSELFTSLLHSITINESNIQLAAYAVTIISAVLWHKNLLATYINIKQPLDFTKSQFTYKQTKNLLQKRSMHVRNFNIITLPIIAVYTYLIQNSDSNQLQYKLRFRHKFLTYG